MGLILFLSFFGICAVAIGCWATKELHKDNKANRA